jgi:hypothetical protein
MGNDNDSLLGLVALFLVCVVIVIILNHVGVINLW